MLYKTKNGLKTGFVPGVGRIVDGLIETSVLLEGGNLELVETKQEEQQQPNQTAPVETPTQPTPPVSAPAAPAVSQPIQQATQTAVAPNPQPVQNTNNVIPGAS